MAERWPSPVKDALLVVVFAAIALSLLLLQGPPDNDPSHFLIAWIGALVAIVPVARILGVPLLLPKKERRYDTAWAVRAIVACVWLLIALRTVVYLTDVSNYVVLGMLAIGSLAAVAVGALVRHYRPKSWLKPASTGTTYRLAPLLIIVLIAGALVAWYSSSVAVGSVSFNGVVCGEGISALICESYAPRMPLIDAWWFGVIVLSAAAAVACWMAGLVHVFMAVVAAQIVVLAFWSEAVWRQMPAATPGGWQHAAAMLIGQVVGSVLLLVAFYVGSAYRRTPRVRRRADYVLDRSSA